MDRQYQTDVINELAGALAKAQAEMTHAGKSADNPFFKSKYADLSAVISAARPALSKNGLSVVQFTDMDEAGKVFLITQLSHSSGQWMRSWYPVTPVKNDPQGLGSATTYARRYAYGSIVGVAAADEDDDGNAASGHKVDSKPENSQKLFSNAAMRNAYTKRCIDAYEEAESKRALNELFNLDLPKLTEMKASEEHDKLAAEEIHKRYKVRLSILSQDEINKESFPQIINDSRGAANA